MAKGTRRAKAKSKSRSRKLNSVQEARGPRSGWRIPDDEVEKALITGEYAPELEEMLGPAEYAELRQLAAEAHKRRGGKKVLIVPGLMGSKLGEHTKLLGIFSREDVYWVDPIDVAIGRLGRIAIDSKSRNVVPLGVFLSAYLKLKLRLRAEGLDADYYPYDWRRPIDGLGDKLAREIKGMSGPVWLVAHSMGGLVSRAAIKHGARVERLIQLGSPNFGSYAPLMALRGSHDAVKKLALLDLKSNATELINRIFRNFPGLLELLPSLSNDPGTVFFDPKQWPKDQKKKTSERLLAPSAALLSACSKVQSALAPVDPDRWTLIAGINQQTVTQAVYKPDIDDVEYTRTFDGDGTVPFRFASVPGMPVYFVEDKHGELANNKLVARAVADIIDHGTTDALPTKRPVTRRAADKILESELRAQNPLPEVPAAVAASRNEPGADEAQPRSRKARGKKSRKKMPAPSRDPRAVQRQLRAIDRRHLLDGFVGAGDSAASPVRVDVPVHMTSEVPSPWNRLVVARARQHRIDVQIANCSITQVSARAYVLGLFREVTPTGAAAYIDQRLDGAVTDFMRRRMFSGAVGEVFIMPANRSRLRADMVLFAGMGYFDQFNDEVQQTTAESVIRTFVRTNVEDFATVLFGGASGSDVPALLTNLLTGFVRGKLDADVDHHFRRVIICETDPGRYQEIRTGLYKLAETPLCDDIEITFTELPVPSVADFQVEAPSERGRVERLPDPVYLIVRREREEGAGGEKKIVFGSAALTAGAKAAIMSAEQQVKANELEAMLRKTGSTGFDIKAGEALGRYLAEKVIAEPIRQILPRDKHLVIVHDAPSSRIPWETLNIGGWKPALGDGASNGGMSRRYMAGALSVAKYLEQRPPGTKLRLLLVVNPTGDLDGAAAEGDQVHELFKQRTDVEVKRLDESKATRKAVLAELSSGSYDLVHYAGHAFFDPEIPDSSGLLCHDDEPLTGADLGTIGNLPKLVFFNACESGRVRRRVVLGKSPTKRSKRQKKVKKHKEITTLDRNGRVAPAEAFLRGGIANFIGTYWPVGDDSAKSFSKTFYAALLEGRPMFEAIVAGRRAVAKEKSVDWSDYIHFGDYGFTIR